MNEVQTISLGEIMAKKSGSVDPSKYPDEVFDLYSIPAFDSRQPEVVSGKLIGSTKQIVEPDDVLLSKIVPHIRRSWVVGEKQGRRIIASGEWIVFRSEKIYPNYLRHVLVSDPFHLKFMSTVSGVGGSLLRARPAFVEKIKIPLPSLPEQQRIAEILDRAEALRAKRRAALAQLDELTQSIFIEMFGEPVTSQTKWPISSLEKSCEKITDGTHHSPSIKPTGVPYITAKHLKQHGLDFESDPWFVSEEDHKKIFSRCDPRVGDVLYIKDGATTGLAALNHYTYEFSMLSSLALLRPKIEKMEATYLCFWLNNPLVKKEILGGMAGAAIQRLTLSKIKSINIPIPPLSLQKEFSHRVSAVEKLKTTYRASLVELDEFFASLQYRAFRGEL
ncbi:MAG: restriction endonuclease subunit S [Methanosarcina mazei]